MDIKKITGLMVSIVLLLKLYFTKSIEISVELKTILLTIGLILIIFISARKKLNK